MHSPSEDGWTTNRYHYKSAAAKRAVDFSAIEGDLEIAAESLAAFTSLSPSEASSNLPGGALWTHAVTFYARCFTDGRRPKIDHILRICAMDDWNEAQSVHDHVMGWRNKHLAHAVSDLERTGTVIEVGTKMSSEGWALRARPGGVVQTAIAPGAGSDLPHRFTQLVDLLIARVQLTGAEAWEEVVGELRNLTPPDLAMLPKFEGLGETNIENWRIRRK